MSSDRLDFEDVGESLPPKDFLLPPSLPFPPLSSSFRSRMSTSNGWTRVSGTTTPSAHTATSRPLVLLHPTTQTRISVNVPSTPQEWIAAEVARDTFHDWIHAQDKDGHLIGFDLVEPDEDNPSQAAEDAYEKELVLSSYFLAHVAGLLSFPSSTSSATAAVLLATFAHFSSHFLATTDVHSLAASFPTPVRSLVVSSYFAARTKLEFAGLGKSLPTSEQSALLQEASAGSSELYALFGGQGMNEVYFEELQVRSFRAPNLSSR